MFNSRIERVSNISLTLLNSEERKAVVAHQLDVEQKRVVATMRALHRILR